MCAVVEVCLARRVYPSVDALCRNMAVERKRGRDSPVRRGYPFYLNTRSRTFRLVFIFSTYTIKALRNVRVLIIHFGPETAEIDRSNGREDVFNTAKPIDFSVELLRNIA